MKARKRGNANRLPLPELAQCQSRSAYTHSRCTKEIGHDGACYGAIGGVGEVWLQAWVCPYCDNPAPHPAEPCLTDLRTERDQLHAEVDRGRERKVNHTPL